MNTLLYTQRDAEEWAAFSGDYNPVHFDNGYAHKIGLEKTSVHGMRMMLDIKQRLTTALLTEKPENDFYLCSTRLRYPVLCGEPYQLQIAGVPGHPVARLLNAAQEGCVTSKLAPAPALKEPESQRHEREIAAEQIMAFSGKYPGNAEENAWVFFDALLFHLLLQTTDTLMALPELQATKLNEVFTRLPVMQTHHETHFSARLFHAGRSLLDEPLRWTSQPTLVMGSKETGYILRTVIQAKAQQPLIATAVTLKTWAIG
ncbi:MaoC/PaaZ C-terminal domain-containing protein [Kalamiella sp. sgz302252]|uniref:MaoC/PaaZ C-terminal domain-containing protein n=1 Tax=Pantoea sp. sgz302252 TaxID=3341827 RepID=UPI0036D3D1AD